MQLQESCITMHHANEQCVENLISADRLLYPRPHERNLDLSKLAMKAFSKCPLTMLKGLIYVRVFKDAGVRLNSTLKCQRSKGT